MDAELETPSAIQVSDNSLLAWDHSGPLGCCHSIKAGSLSQTTVIRASTYAMNTSSNHSIPACEKGHGFRWESIVVESQKFFICAESRMGVCVIVWWEMNKECVAITVVMRATWLWGLWGTGNVDDSLQRETVHKDGQGPQAEHGYYPPRFSQIPAEQGTVSAAESNWQQTWEAIHTSSLISRPCIKANKCTQFPLISPYASTWTHSLDTTGVCIMIVANPCYVMWLIGGINVKMVCTKKKKSCHAQRNLHKVCQG